MAERSVFESVDAGGDDDLPFGNVNTDALAMEGGEGVEVVKDRLVGGRGGLEDGEAKGVGDATAVVDEASDLEVRGAERSVVIADGMADGRGEVPGGGEPFSGDGVIEVIDGVFVGAEVGAVAGCIVKHLQVTGGVDGDEGDAADVVEYAGGIRFTRILAGPAGDFRTYYSCGEIVAPAAFEGRNLEDIAEVTAERDRADDSLHSLRTEDRECLEDGANLSPGAEHGRIRQA